MMLPARTTTVTIGAGLMLMNFRIKRSVVAINGLVHIDHGHCLLSYYSGGRGCWYCMAFADGPSTDVEMVITTVADNDTNFSYPWISSLVIHTSLTPERADLRLPLVGKVMIPA
jgi:hypothetical protein